MNQQDIRDLEKELWDAADELRGNSKLTAAEYKDPLLGLVLLRFAQNRYEDAKVQVDSNLTINHVQERNEQLLKMITPQQERLSFQKRLSMIIWLPYLKVMTSQRLLITL